MIAVLKTARGDISRHLATAEPDRVTSAQAAELVELFAEVERLSAAGRVLYARRAADSAVWRREGHRSAAAWMAAKTGTGLGDAVASLKTAEALESLPSTSEALRRGDLSVSQAREITTAAAVHPEAEGALLKAAAEHGYRGLRDRCAQVRAASSSARQESERYDAIHASRYFRHYSESDGALRLDARLTPDAGAKLVSAIEAEAKSVFERARRSGNKEPSSAYAADALVALVSGTSRRSGRSGGRRSGPGAVVHIRVDMAALRRGNVRLGETCEIPGVGPVPVATATKALSDAFVKIFVTDGVDIQSVCHVGRSVPAHVQSALEERDPVCVVPGCEVAHSLENHHWDVPYVECRTSNMGGLARICAWHHHVVTYGGHELVGGPGRWELQPPPGGALVDSG
ncbi:MAG TPA: DUF222 domain-containing protein [Acidimicrobiales bacterium]|nr:DUF222 domain-containing protein [Acidimicrobiales bacterium]